MIQNNVAFSFPPISFTFTFTEKKRKRPQLTILIKSNGGGKGGVWLSTGGPVIPSGMDVDL